MTPLDPAAIKGAEVRSSDGTALGNLSAVHVPDGSDEPMFLQIVSGRAGAELIAPALDAIMREGTVVLPYSGYRVSAGPTVASDAELSVGEAATILTYYGAGAVDLGDRPLTDRVTDVGDVDAVDPGVRRLPPIVVIRPGLHDDADAEGNPEAPQGKPW